MGGVIEKTDCCPQGMACNFGMLSINKCLDGSCTVRDAPCPSEDVP